MPTSVSNLLHANGNNGINGINGNNTPNSTNSDESTTPKNNNTTLVSVLSGLPPPPPPPSGPKPTTTDANEGPECDYDVNPTRLYLCIQHKKWEDVSKIVNAHPDQCKIWVLRKEEQEVENMHMGGIISPSNSRMNMNIPSSPTTTQTPKNANNTNSNADNSNNAVTPKKQPPKLRWRLLPLHAAIIFKAPESIIQTLLTAFPRACCYKDDQGMLPIHLSLRNESTEAVVMMLLVAYPQCISIGDRKNRTPLHIANVSKLPLKDAYLKCLSSHKLYYDVAAASYNAHTLYEVKHNPSTNLANGSGNTANGQDDIQTLALMGKVDSLEVDLAKARNENQLLVDHVNSMTSKLTSHTDSEDFFVTKITKLENQCKEIRKQKELMEAQYKREISKLTHQIDELKIENITQNEEIELYRQINDEKDKSLEIVNESTFAHGLEREQLEKKVQYLEIENESALANATVLETQLKKKIQNEHSLAKQVSDLATKLSENALMYTHLTTSHQRRIDSYQNEKTEMKIQYDIMAQKLQDALITMDKMANENNRIVELSANQERVISESFKQQEELAAHAARHEQSLIDAAWEREEIVRILTRQAEEVEKSNQERIMLMKVVKTNNMQISNSSNERNQLLSSISKQKGLMDSLKKDVVDLYAAVSDETDGLISLNSDKENDNNTCEGDRYEQQQQQQQQPSRGYPQQNRRSASRSRNINGNHGHGHRHGHMDVHENFNQGLDDNHGLNVGTEVTSSGSIEITQSISPLSSSDSDDGFVESEGDESNDVESDADDNQDEKERELKNENDHKQKEQILEVSAESLEGDEEESEEEEDGPFSEISMNARDRAMHLKTGSMDDVESSVDNLCKEAAALIASIPSPNKKVWK
jgi:hypothetical protein